MGNGCHPGSIELYPGSLDVLWPPPTWLWSIDMSKRIGDVEAALDDILTNAPAEKLEAMSTDLNLMLTLPESIKTNTASGDQLCKCINLQDNQVGTSSNAAGTPQQSETTGADAFISDEMKKLNGNILLVEELMTKTHHSVKSCQQPSLDAVN